MSRTRDGMNLYALRRMLGGRPPREAADQPLLAAAVGAGGGPGGGLSSWSSTLTIEAALTPGVVYYYNAGWSVLSPTVGVRAAVAVCIAYVDADPDTSTLLLGGELARSGTAGAPLFVGSGGSITETFPGDETNETTDAPWVWPIGWQITSDLAIILPCDPYRPRIVTVCATDGATQLAFTMREYPPDPA